VTSDDVIELMIAKNEAMHYDIEWRREWSNARAERFRVIQKKNLKNILTQTPDLYIVGKSN